MHSDSFWYIGGNRQLVVGCRRVSIRKLLLYFFWNFICDIVLLCAEQPNPPKQLTVSDITSTSFKLSWCCAEGNVVSFEVQYRQQSQNSVQSEVYKKTVTSSEYTAIGLRPSTTYSVWVLALNSSGGRSLSSDVIQCTTLQPGEVLLIDTGHSRQLIVHKYKCTSCN